MQNKTAEGFIYLYNPEGELTQEKPGFKVHFSYKDMTRELMALLKKIISQYPSLSVKYINPDDKVNDLARRYSALLVEVCDNIKVTNDSQPEESLRFDQEFMRDKNKHKRQQILKIAEKLLTTAVDGTDKRYIYKLKRILQRGIHNKNNKSLGSYYKHKYRHRKNLSLIVSIRHGARQEILSITRSRYGCAKGTIYLGSKTQITGALYRHFVAMQEIINKQEHPVPDLVFHDIGFNDQLPNFSLRCDRFPNGDYLSASKVVAWIEMKQRDDLTLSDRKIIDGYIARNTGYRDDFMKSVFVQCCRNLACRTAVAPDKKSVVTYTQVSKGAKDFGFFADVSSVKFTLRCIRSGP